MNHRIVKLILAWALLAASAMSAVPGWSATVEQMQAERRQVSKEVDRMDREIAAMKNENQMLQPELQKINAVVSNPKLYVISPDHTLKIWIAPTFGDFFYNLGKGIGPGWVAANEKQLEECAYSIAAEMILTASRIGAGPGPYEIPPQPEDFVSHFKSYSASSKKTLSERAKEITNKIRQNKQDIAQQQAARQKLEDRFIDLDNQLSGKKVKTATSGFPLSWSFHSICPSGKYKGEYSSGWSMSPPDLNGDFTGSFAGTHTGTIQGTVSGTGIRFKRTFMRDGGKVIQTWTGTVDSTGKNISGSLTDPKGGCSFTATAQ